MSLRKSLLLIASIVFISRIGKAEIFSMAYPGACCSALGGQFQQVIAVGWTDSSAENDVVIDTTVGGGVAGSSVTAYLMNQIGPGTTSANQLASITFVPTLTPENIDLFNVNLAAGAYYVVFSANSTGAGLGFANSGSNLKEGATVSSAYEDLVNVIPGNSHGTLNAYAPASTFFNQTFEISSFGDSISVEVAPEPSTFFLIAAGLSVVVLGRKKCQPSGLLKIHPLQ